MFYDYNLVTGVCQGLSWKLCWVMEFEVLSFYLDKKGPPEDKELYLIHLSHCRKLYHLSLIFTELY